MGLARAHQVFVVEFKDHLSGAHSPNDIRVHVCHCFAGDFERERPTVWMPIILAELLKVIVYLTINVGKVHLCSYAASSSAAAVSYRRHDSGRTPHAVVESLTTTCSSHIVTTYGCTAANPFPRLPK
jgi:hypothetical protein